MKPVAEESVRVIPLVQSSSYWRRAPQRQVAGALEIDVLGDQIEKAVEVAVVVAIDVPARELTWSGHLLPLPSDGRPVCACSATWRGADVLSHMVRRSLRPRPGPPLSQVVDRGGCTP